MLHPGTPRRLGQGSQNPRAPGLGQLGRGGAHRPGRADDQEGLTGLEISGLDHALPGGEESHSRGGGLGVGKGSGFQGQGLGGSRQHFGVAAVPAETQVAAASENFPAHQFGRAFQNHAGKVPTRNPGQGGEGEFSHHVLGIAGVDGGRLDLHQGLAGRGNGQGALAQRQFG